MEVTAVAHLLTHHIFHKLLEQHGGGPDLEM